MKDLIKRNLIGKKVLILFILTNITYSIMLFITIPKVMAYSGGMKLLDMMPTGYAPEYVNSLLAALGPEGRNAYLYQQLPVDMIYPILFAISYCLVFAYFLNKIRRLDSYLYYFCFLPLLSGFSDYCENIGFITMLNSYPDNSISLMQATSFFSVLKSFSTTIYFVVLIILLITFGWSKIFKIPSESTKQ